MRVRKNVRSLSDGEKQALVKALLELKKAGHYDHFVHAHMAVMHPTVLSYEPRDPEYRNGAHRGSSFLPWHREFLLQLEDALRSIDSSIALPYWDWTEDAAMDDPTTAPIWSEDFMGGNGVEADDWRVATGPFAYSSGNWPISPDHDGPALRRQFGQMLPTLPTKEDLALAMAERFCDTPHYNNSPFNIGFRNRLEGWITQRGDSRVKTAGSQLHNRVHLWIGGSMAPMTSPNDPVFFLHHCFVDKIWADWQAKQRKDRPEAAPHYAPEQDGPPGHNLGDTIRPWTRKISEVLDITALDYSYEQPPSPDVMALVERLEPAGPFDARQSPFWAD